MEINELTVIALYGLIGGVYAVSGYVNAIVDGEKTFDPMKFGKTVAIGAIAGALIAFQGDDLSPGALEAIMAGLVPVADQLLNAQRKSKSGR